jgi:hypothetical protein
LGLDIDRRTASARNRRVIRYHQFVVADATVPQESFFGACQELGSRRVRKQVGIKIKYLR